jgi:hypothetical protein
VRLIRLSSPLGPGPDVTTTDTGVQPVDVVLDVGSGVPTIVHWGTPLTSPGTVLDDDAEQELLASLVAALRRPITGGALDSVAPLSLVPEHGSGHDGRPGLLGHRRQGRAWAPRFTLVEVEILEGALLDGEGATPVGCRVRAVDEIAELELISEIRLGVTLEVACTVVNRSADRYLLDGLTLCIPMPAHAELLTFDGRWTRELHPCAAVDQRAPGSSRTGAAARRTSTPRSCSRASRGSASGTARCGACTWRGAATTPARRMPARRSPLRAARRAAAPRRGVRSSPVSRTVARGDRHLLERRPHARDAGGSTVRPCAADPCTRRSAAAGAAQHVGGGLLRPRHRTAAAAGHQRPPTSGSSGSCSTTAGSARRDDRRASATGGCRPTCTPTVSAR